MPALLSVLLALTALAEPARAAQPSATASDDEATQGPRPEAPRTTDLSPQPRRYQIERIRILGLEHAKESEVRRHLLVAEGELLDPDRVLLTRLRLLQLGWFSRVDTRVEKGSERGLVVLVIEVAERNTLIVTDFILGSTPPEPLYGGLGLSQQNFLGRGFGLSGAFVYGGSPAGRPQDPERYALRGSFFAPSLEVAGSKRGLVLGATVFLAHGEEFDCGDPKCSGYTADYGLAPRIRYERLMGEVTVGVRPGPFERLLASYRYEGVHATQIGPATALSGLEPSVFLQNSIVSALTGTYEFDTRDDFFFPRDGLRGLFQVTFGSRLLGSDYEYSRYLLQLETAFALLARPLRFQGAIGIAQGSAPFFDRFYGADFSYFAIGPALGRALELNFSTDPRYDAFLAMAGLEYGIPIWSRRGFFRRGYIALGARGVYSTATLGGKRTSFSRSPVSGDVALRFDTPVGVFNLSAGYLLDNLL